MKLAITTYATESYAYALEVQLALWIACVRYAGVPFEEVVFILAGDSSAKVNTVAKSIKEELKECGIPFHRIVLKVSDNKNAEHEAKSNLVIARLQAAAWHKARMLGAELCWSLESDILPPGNALQCMLDVLQFDHGLYHVAFCPYDNGDILGGHGSPTNVIHPNVWDDERLIPVELQERIYLRDARKQDLAQTRATPTKEDEAEWELIKEDIKKCSPKGNTHALNAIGWKQRGWLTSAYPGVGIGAIVPTRWVGLGCTLMSRRALDLANFSGYTGGGTQDLWLGWRVWYPRGLLFGLIPHVLCDHVKVDKKTKKLTIHRCYHEFQGECVGHPRVEKKDWEGI